MIAKTRKKSLVLAKRLYPLTKAQGRSRTIVELYTKPEDTKPFKVCKGPQEYELRRNHALGKCGAFCGYCWHEMEKYVENEKRKEVDKVKDISSTLVEETHS